jgi:putative ABC transport system permease protein
VTLLVRIAFRNLLAARGRTLLLGSAIGIVTAMLVLLLSLAGGIEDNLVRSATTLSAGHVSVAGFYKSKPTDAAPLVTEADAIEAILRAETPGLDYVVRRQRGWGKLISPEGSVQVGLSGLDYDAEQRMFGQLELAAERDYVADGGDATPGDFSKLRDQGSILLFVAQAKKLGVRVGDVITVQTETQGGQTNTIDLQVCCVARDVGLLSSFAVFADARDLRQLYRLNDDTTGAFWVYLDDIDDAEDVMNHYREVFAAKGYRVMDHVPAPFFFKFDGVSGEDWTGQKLDFTIWSDEVSFLLWVLTAFDALTWSLSLILLAIIAMGIMNALYAAVRERTTELGTLRAIGMGRWQVLGMVLAEALLLGLFATTGGAVVGSGAALLLDALALDVGVDAMQVILLADTFHFVVRPVSVGTAVLLLTALTGLAALWPAARAAALRPVVAMQAAE